MEATLTETMAAFERSGERIDEILRQAASLPLRVPRLAEMLRSFWPSSPLYACLLEAKDDSYCCVLDESGKSRTEWSDLVRGAFHQRGKRGAHKPADSAKLSKAMKLSGCSLVVEEIVFGAHRWGVLVLALPKNASPEAVAIVRMLLAVCSEQLAARLQSEAQARAYQALQKELEGQSWLASTGELAEPLAHEFNNFLNIVLLHVALLEAEIPERFRQEFTELRRQGASMTSLVVQFQEYRRRLQPVQEQVDINLLVRAAVGAFVDPQSEPNRGLVIKLPLSSSIASTGLGRPAAVPLNLVLTPDLSPVLGSVADLRRLCTFLLTNASAAAGPVGGSVTLRTEPANGTVLLRLEDTGPSVSPELLPHLFEPTTAGRAGTNPLELAACETLVRRLQGKIRCENRAEGGVVVLVELPKAPSKNVLSQTASAG